MANITVYDLILYSYKVKTFDLYLTTHFTDTKSERVDHKVISWDCENRYKLKDYRVTMFEAPKRGCLTVYGYQEK